MDNEFKREEKDNMQTKDVVCNGKRGFFHWYKWNTVFNGAVPKVYSSNEKRRKEVMGKALYKSEKESVKIFGLYTIVYDKYVPNGKHGIEVERKKIRAETKEIAMRQMKMDVYRNGVANAIATAKLPNGEKIDFKVHREPRKLTAVENPKQFKVISRTRYKACSQFGVFD